MVGMAVWSMGDELSRRRAAQGRSAVVHAGVDDFQAAGRTRAVADVHEIGAVVSFDYLFVTGRCVVHGFPL
ncbi:MAG: hypothetical protein JWN18_619 [Parcubacteria group bacterium]|nr:hypothetical protein [Parcubacteria group bacterium]